ncbi:uncharacterized protein LOC133823867 [Humulus lupulus]|uniref:uncharacterized protein LOC133823867 n=1 Tax=Humulus lupulus TaxID=3486 RepID=UPI002B417396|nr:uncharacterized protein LOC133823867 [Humulus lupulus]
MASVPSSTPNVVVAPDVASSSPTHEGLTPAVPASSSLVHLHRPPPTSFPRSSPPPLDNHGGLGILSASTSPPCQPSHMDHTYHLGTGDNPNFLISTRIPTGQENFQSWKSAASISIAAKNKTQFINGSLPQPHPFEHYFHAWIQCNNMVMAWLLQSVSHEIQLALCSKIQPLLYDLHERFNQGNGPWIFQLQTSVHTIKQGDSDINSYFTRLKTIWDELKEFQPIIPCSCGCKCGAVERLLGYYHRDQIMQFLVGLNDSYSSVRAQILLYDPLPPLSKVFSPVSQEERQRSISHPTPFITVPGGLNNSTKPPTSRSKKPRPTCSHCLKPGHLVDKCFFLHGFPPGYGDKRCQDEARKPSVHQASTPLVSASILGKPPTLSQTELSQQLISLLSQNLQHNSAATDNTLPIASQVSGNLVDFPSCLVCG